MWQMLIPMVAGAYLGKKRGDEQQRAMNDYNKMQADIEKNSWRTGVRGKQEANMASPWGSMLQGLAGGAAIGQSIHSAMKPELTPRDITNSINDRTTHMPLDARYNMNDFRGYSVG